MNNDLAERATTNQTVIGPRTSDLIEMLDEHIVPAHRILFSEHPEIASIGEALSVIFKDRDEVPVFTSFFSNQSPLMSMNPLLRKFSSPEIQLLLTAPGQSSSISLDVDKIKFLSTFVLGIAVHALHNQMLDSHPELAVRHIFGDGSTEDIVRLAAQDDDDQPADKPNTARGTRVSDALVRQVTPQAYRNATLQDLIDATSVVAYRGLLTACSANNFGKLKNPSAGKMARMSKAVMSASFVRYYERQLEATRSMLQQGRRAKLKNGLQLVSNPPIGPFMNGNSYYWRAVGDSWTDPAMPDEGPRSKVAGMAFVSWAGAPHQLPDSLKQQYEKIYSRDLESYFVGLSPEKIQDIVGLDPSTARAGVGAHREFSVMFAADPKKAQSEMESVMLRGFNTTVDALASNGPQIEKFIERFPALRERSTYDKITQAAAKLVALISVNPPTSWSEVTPVCQSAMDQVSKQALDGDANSTALLAKVATIAMELPIDLDTHVSNVDFRSAVTPKLDLYGSEPPQVNIGDTPVDIYTTLRILAPHQKSKTATGHGFINNISGYNYEPDSLAMRIDSLFAPAKQENETDLLAHVLEIGRALTAGENVSVSTTSVKRVMGAFAHAVAHIREKISIVLKGRGMAADALEHKIAAIRSAKATSQAMIKKNNYEMAKAQNMVVALESMGSALAKSNPEQFSADFCVSILTSALQIVATSDDPVVGKTARAVVARGGAAQIADIADFCKLAYAKHPFTRGQVGSINVFSPVTAATSYNTLTKYKNVAERGITRSGPEHVGAEDHILAEFSEYRTSSHAVADLLETNHFAKRLPANESAAKNDLASIYGQGDATKSMLISSVEAKADELSARIGGSRSMLAQIVGEGIDREGSEMPAIQRFMLTNNRQTVIRILTDFGLDSDYYDALMLALSRKVAGDSNFIAYTAEKLARRYTFVDKTEISTEISQPEGGGKKDDEDEPAPAAGGKREEDGSAAPGSKGKKWASTADPNIVAEMRAKVEDALLTAKVTKRGMFEQYCGAGFFSEFFAKAEMAEGGGDQADIAQKYVNRIRPRSGTGSSTKFAGLLRKRMMYAVGANFGRENSMRITALLRQHAADGATFVSTGAPMPTTQAGMVRDLWETSEEDSRIYCDPWHAAVGLVDNSSASGDSFRKAIARALTGVGPIATSEDASYPEIKEKLQQYFAYKRKALMDRVRTIREAADRDFMIGLLSKAPTANIDAPVYSADELARLKTIGTKIVSGNDAVDESARQVKIALETVFQSDWWKEQYSKVLLGLQEVKAAKITTAREIASRIRSSTEHVMGFEVELSRLPADSRNSPLHALKNSIDKVGLVFAGAPPRHNYASESPRARITAAINEAASSEVVIAAIANIRPAGSTRIMQGKQAADAIRKDTRTLYAVQAKVSAEEGASFITDADMPALVDAVTDALVDFIESGDATVSILQGVAMDSDSAEYREMGRADTDDEAEEQSVAAEATVLTSTFNTDEDFYSALAEHGFLSQEGISLVRAAKGAERILPANFDKLPAAQAATVMRERIDALKTMLSKEMMATAGSPMDQTWRGQVKEFQTRQAAEFKRRVVAKMDRDDTIDSAKATALVQRELRSEFARRDIKLADAARDALDKVSEFMTRRADVSESKAKFVSMAANNLASVPGLNQALTMAGMVANYSLAAGRPTAVTKQYYEDGISQFDQAVAHLEDHINREMGAVGRLIEIARKSTKSPTIADLERLAPSAVTAATPTADTARAKFEELVRLLQAAFKDRGNKQLQAQIAQIVDSVQTDINSVQMRAVVAGVMNGRTPTWDDAGGSLRESFEAIYGDASVDTQDTAETVTRYVRFGGEKIVKLIATLAAVDARKAEYEQIKASLLKVDDSSLAEWRNTYATFKAQVEPDIEAEELDSEDEAEVEDIAEEISNYKLDIKPTNIEYGRSKEQEEASAIKEVNKVTMNLLSAIENQVRTMESVPSLKSKDEADEYKSQLMKLVADVRATITDPNDVAVRKLTSSTNMQNYVRTIAQICASSSDGKALVDLDEARENFNKLRAMPDANEVIDTGEFESVLSIGLEFGADPTDVALQLELAKEHRAFIGRAQDYIRAKSPTPARAAALRFILALDANNVLSPDPIDAWMDKLKNLIQQIVRDSDEGIDVLGANKFSEFMDALGRMNIALRQAPSRSPAPVSPPPLPLQRRPPADPMPDEVVSDEVIEVSPDDIVEMEGDSDLAEPDNSLHSLEGEIDHLMSDFAALARRGGDRTRPMLQSIYALQSRLRDAPRVDLLMSVRDQVRTILNKINALSAEQRLEWLANADNAQRVRSLGLAKPAG